MAEKRTKADLEKLKEYAKLLYIKDNLTQKEIAIKTGVSEKTIGKWVADGIWDKQKKNFVLTRQEQMSNMLDELTEINEVIKKRPPGERYANSKEGDVRRKLVKDIKELETKTVSKENAIDVCIQVLEFARQISLKASQDIAPIVDGYIKSLY